jgi:hypothetical protein
MRNECHGLKLFAVAGVLAVIAGAHPAWSGDEEPPAFAGEVGAANYERLPDPEEPLLVRWSFTDGAVYSYLLSERSETASNFPDGDLDEPTRSSSAGRFEIKAEGDHEAKIVLSDVNVAVQRGGDADEDADASFNSPPVVVRGLREDGSLPTADSQQNALFRLLFPLPEPPMAVGETSTLPFQFPVNVFGSPLTAEGEIEMTLTALVYVRGTTCAQVDFVVGIGEIEIPEEIQTEFDFDVSGTGRYFFDVNAGRLVESTVAVRMAMDADFPSEFMPTREENQPAMRNISMVNDVLIRLTSD